MNAFNTVTAPGPAPASPLPGSAVPGAVKASRRVVDAPTRMFHWLFALCFAGAYITADG
jgi:hypothetical protein